MSFISHEFRLIILHLTGKEEGVERKEEGVERKEEGMEWKEEGVERKEGLEIARSIFHEDGSSPWCFYKKSAAVFSATCFSTQKEFFSSKFQSSDASGLQK